MKFIEGYFVNAIRTFNNEDIIGRFKGYYSPTQKMKQNNIEVGIVQVINDRCYDVYQDMSYLEVNEEYVPYDLSLLLKNIGFNCKCDKAFIKFNNGKEISKKRYSGNFINSDIINVECTSPTYERAFTFLETCYGIYTNIIFRSINVEDGYKIAYKFQVYQIYHNRSYFVDDDPGSDKWSKLDAKYEALKYILTKMFTKDGKFINTHWRGDDK
jgi:hypothetical protein